MIELDVIDQATADHDAESGPQFWQHPAQLDKDASEEEEHVEFGPGASEPPSGASRRKFLEIMGAAMAMAGLTSCRRPEEKILPYAQEPEEVIPGIARYYATSMPFRGVVRPVLVETNEERPTKVEGNAEHPAGQSGTSPFGQASVLNLYDPDRSRSVLKDGAEADWSEFVRFCRGLEGQANEQNMAVLIKENSSPTIAAMQDRMEDRFPNLQWVSYSPEGDDPVRLGMQQAFGQPLRPEYAFGDAEVIVSLDDDFLDGKARNFLHNTKAFADGRRLETAEDDMSRLYMVESHYSTTGGTADHRLRMRASRITALAAAIGAELGVGSAPDRSWSKKEELYIQAMAEDLQEAGEQGIILAGPSQPPEVHALAMAMNEQLGSVGTTVTLYDTGTSSVQSQDEALADLVEDMDQGDIDTLVMVGVNPVYSLPADLNFEEALSNVEDSVHVGLRVNETARASRWHVPKTHYMESWGDGRAYNGTLSVIQPLIRPLYDAAHSEIEILNLLATGVVAEGHDLVRDLWRDILGENFEEQWRQVLHDGYLEDSQYSEATVGSVSVPEITTQEEEGLEVVFRLSPKVLGGRFSNNAWMQELPHPVTKIVWDNVALMSQATAEELDLVVDYSEGDFRVDRIELSVGGESVELPVWIQPGYPDGTIGVILGYGRKISTSRDFYDTPFWDVSDETDVYNYAPIAGGLDDSGEPVDVVGSNVAPLRPAGGQVATGAEVTKVDSGYLIATTQQAKSMHGRPIIRWATLEEFREDPYFVDDDSEPVPDLGPGGEDVVHAEDNYGLMSGTGTEGHALEERPSGKKTDNGGHGAQRQEEVHEGQTERRGDEAEAPGVEGFWEYPMIWQDDHPKDEPAYRESPYFDNQWGMSIDLNTCTGCNSCIVACTSENNVQVVGKEEVSNGRHMYWIRTDRYYVTEGEEGTEDPEMMMQPMLCQHCENAPCESVCPVAATVHSPDGTNQMIYNRCIGTRYCENNCPYKVRRFNFFNWSKTLPTEVQMAHNPEVSVRTKGVMEKCTWCIHRIRDKQRQADNEDRDLQPNEVKTACQEACPTNAITFGDLNKPDSNVVKEKRNPRRYELLAYLNVKPRLSYLGRVRNTNSRLEEALASQAESDEPAEDEA